MLRQISTVALTAALLLSPVLAAEETEFGDVAAGSWYEEGVGVCVEEGLMEGVGDGRFAPENSLSGTECAVLALRVHSLFHGGDGTFPRAPEGWGYATLTFADRTTVSGYLDDETAWDWIRISRVDDGHIGFRLDSEEEKAWGKALDYQSARVTLDGVEYPGTLHLEGDFFLYFEPDDFWAFRAVQQARSSAPEPGKWYRDAWYYAQEEGLDGLLSTGNDDRGAFAQRMAAVTELPALNSVTELPDTADEDVLALYNAGVLTGSDAYGTFHGGSRMTRAEAAAICARILRPELRVAFSPARPETYENYTLTYLRDDAERPYGPYMPLQSEILLAPGDGTLLRLDGAVLPLPKGYEVVSVEGGQAGVWSESAFTYGIVDSQGNFRASTQEEAYALNSYVHTDGELYHGYAAQGCYRNADGVQVTEAFQWAGPVSEDGAAFVEKQGKIWRIQFE
ncbi:hypothetical protein CE91St43_29470 [Oscillospiraceae bacterium]|nr:hypothetical protein CE91St43_29470 [Oscillospiraceae bacterium]